MNCFDFVKKYTTFKPPPFHETVFEAMEKANVEDSKRWYKDLCLDQLYYANIVNLRNGQTFAVATPGGIHIFKKIKFQSYQNEETNTNPNTEEGETNG